MKVFPSLAADVACFLLLSSAVFAQHYKQGNLQPGHGGLFGYLIPVATELVQGNSQ
jgi:hypothetical protein